MATSLKWPRRGALAVLVLTAAAAGGFLWLRGSLPQIDGERVLPGLEAPVEVIRDQHGIPHIAAESEEDALYALGFVHAQDRMWQMEMNRRIGSGRLGEVLGAAALETDRLLRVLGLRHRAKASLEHLEPASSDRLAAYARGVNAWIESRRGPLPPEFLVLGVEPAPWTATDSALVPKLMSLDVAREWTRDRMRLRLSKVLPPESDRRLLYPVSGRQAAWRRPRPDRRIVLAGTGERQPRRRNIPPCARHRRARERVAGVRDAVAGSRPLPDALGARADPGLPRLQ